MLIDADRDYFGSAGAEAGLAGAVAGSVVVLSDAAGGVGVGAGAGGVAVAGGFTADGVATRGPGCSDSLLLQALRLSTATLINIKGNFVMMNSSYP